MSDLESQRKIFEDPLESVTDVENPDFDPTAHGKVANLVRRGRLTVQYLGWRTLLWRILTYPLRYTPLGLHIGYGSGHAAGRRRATAWYKRHGKPVTVVIPTYGDPSEVAEAVRSIRATVPAGRVQIVVPDDGSAPEHQEALRALEAPDCTVILGEENVGFAANANRGLRLVPAGQDAVLINSDVVARDGWLGALQQTATGKDVGMVAPKLLYPDGRIQFAGTVRNRGAREWFDHRFRFRNRLYGPATLTAPTLAVTGACMYVRADVIEKIGLLDENYPMAYEDVDWCLRAWQAGFRVIYQPLAEMTHKESVTRGREAGEREIESQRYFWQRWDGFFHGRDVHTADGHLRVIYITEDTGVGGGHRDIFEHVNRLRDRGHDAQVWSLDGQPDWFDLRCEVRTFEDYQELVPALAAEDAVKVATWWNTAAPVWLASVTRGIPIYFVQDIETSYYPRDPGVRYAVIESYRHEFEYMTISSWNREQLRKLGLDATLVPPGIDLETFRPLDGVTRRDDQVLALGRTNPLKNLPLTIDAWRALPDQPELCLFGIEPELGAKYGATYVERPSDERVNELFNTCTVFVQTSFHEGFALPPLEAMATGGAVVTTDAHGNRDFCEDGVNCLIADPDVASVSGAIGRLLGDAELRRRLGEAGIRTAADYTWERRIDQLEAFLEGVVAERGGRVTAQPAQPRIA